MRPDYCLAIEQCYTRDLVVHATDTGCLGGHGWLKGGNPPCGSWDCMMVPEREALARAVVLYMGSFDIGAV